MRNFFKFLRDTDWLCVCMLVAVMAGASAMLAECDARHQKKMLENRTDATACPISAQPAALGTLADSSKVYAAQVATASKREIRKLLPSKTLLKGISVKASQVVAADITASVMRDSVRMRTPDSTMLAHGARPSLFSYRDKWVGFRFSLSDSVLRYSVRDSITTVVVREYRHRFLWWRWGTKGYHVKVVNHNPHSTLLYKKFVNSER